MKTTCRWFRLLFVSCVAGSMSAPGSFAQDFDRVYLWEVEPAAKHAKSRYNSKGSLWLKVWEDEEDQRRLRQRLLTGQLSSGFMAIPPVATPGVSFQAGSRDGFTMRAGNTSAQPAQLPSTVYQPLNPAVSPARPVTAYPTIVSTTAGGGAPNGFNINTFLGADVFYTNGFTGSSAIVANIEGGHIWFGHQAFTGATPVYITGTGALTELAGGLDSHATGVAHSLAGRNTNTTTQGIAYGATLWSGNIATVINVDGTFSLTNASVRTTYQTAIRDGLAGQTAHVTNSSWGFTNPTGSEFGDFSRYVDAILFTNPKLSVFSAGNDGPGSNTVGGLGAGYNVLTVGALGSQTGGLPFNVISGFSSRSPNSLFIPNNQTPTSTSAANGSTIANARARVDIVAPGQDVYLAASTTVANSYAQTEGTSFSSPITAGGGTLLADVAIATLAGNARTEGLDGRVLKTVLMTSAIKPANWSNAQTLSSGAWVTTQSLDTTFGAGAMNLTRAYDLFRNGTQSLAGTAGGNVLPMGWDYGIVTRNSTTDYSISSQLTAGSEITATLNWFVNRGITYSGGFPTTEVSFHNLDLEVWQLTGAGGTAQTLVGRSNSLANNSEHLSFTIPNDGFYMVRVVRPNGATGYTANAHAIWEFGTAVNTTPYGLSWFAQPNALARHSNTTANSSGRVGNVKLGDRPGISGTYTLGGASTFIDGASSMYLGGDETGAGGIGRLTIQAGNRVRATDFGRVFNGSRATVAGTLEVGFLQIDAGASVTFTGSGQVYFNGLNLAGELNVNSFFDTTNNYRRTVELASTLVAGARLQVNESFNNTIRFNSGVTLTGSGVVTLAGNGQTIFDSTVSGSGSLTKTGTGDINIFSNASFLGDFRLVGGRAFVSGGGRISAANSITVQGIGSNLNLDNNTNGTQNNDRINNAAIFSLYNGELSYVALNTTGAKSESFGTSTFNLAGINMLQSTPATAAGATTSLTFSAPNRLNQGVLFLQVGTAGNTFTEAAGVGNTVLNFTGTITKLTAGADIGVETGIVPWVTANILDANSNRPRGFATVRGTNLVAVSSADTSIFQAISGSTPLLANANNNIRSNLSVTNVPGNVTVNSLVFDNQSTNTTLTVNAGNNTITVFSGAIAAKDSINVSNTTFDFGANTGFIHLGGTGNTFGANTFLTGSNGVVISSINNSALDLTSAPAQTFTNRLTLNGNLNVTFTNGNVLGGTGQGVTLEGATLTYSGTTTITLDRPLRFGYIGGTINVSSSTGILQNGVSNPSGIGGDSGGMIKTGPGQLIFGAQTTGNLIGPVTINGGQLLLQRNTILNGFSDLTIANADSILNIGTTNQTITSLTMISPNATAPIQGTGTLTISGPITYTSVFNGSLTLATPINLGGQSRILNVARAASAPAYELRLSGAITNGGLTKVGTGIVEFNSSSTLTAGLAINEGTVRINNTVTVTATTSVQANGVLTGRGSVSGTLAINSLGVVQPGDAAGSMSVSGNVQFNAGGIYSWDISAATGTAGTQWDLLSSTGTLTGSATSANRFTILALPLGTITGFNNTQGYSWTIGSFAGGTAGLPLGSMSVDSTAWTGLNALGGGTLNLSYQGNDLVLNFVPVPEPVTLLGFALAGLAGVAWQRRGRMSKPGQMAV